MKRLKRIVKKLNLSQNGSLVKQEFRELSHQVLGAEPECNLFDMAWNSACGFRTAHEKDKGSLSVNALAAWLGLEGCKPMAGLDIKNWNTGKD